MNRKVASLEHREQHRLGDEDLRKQAGPHRHDGCHHAPACRLRLRILRWHFGRSGQAGALFGDGGADPARPVPENPPQDIEVYPPTTNRTVEGPIDYHRKPPTNGNHAPLWQNCGYYPEPIQDRHAVHSMDHGVVWITYRPDLPQKQLETLRSYAN